MSRARPVRETTKGDNHHCNLERNHNHKLNHIQERNRNHNREHIQDRTKITPTTTNQQYNTGIFRIFVKVWQQQ